MKKKLPDPEKIDADNPEWSKEDFQRSMPLSALPKAMQKAISSRKRGPQKRPTKQLVSLRISREVLEHFKAGGPGWQRRIDETLKSGIGKVG
jgi:uncharacterized protein (DUF4415 family)